MRLTDICGEFGFPYGINMHLCIETVTMSQHAWPQPATAHSLVCLMMSARRTRPFGRELRPRVKGGGTRHRLVERRRLRAAVLRCRRGDANADAADGPCRGSRTHARASLRFRCGQILKGARCTAMPVHANGEHTKLERTLRSRGHAERARRVRGDRVQFDGAGWRTGKL